MKRKPFTYEHFRKGTRAELREILKVKGTTESDYRNSIYKSNPEYSRPDYDIERLVQKTFHSTPEDLDEEQRLGI